jgi:anti-anti-sigma factor
MTGESNDDAGFTTRRIKLKGEYDLARQDEIAKEFAGLDGDPTVIVDLSEVTYLDSTVLRELALLRLKRLDRHISLVGADQNVRRLLKIAGLERIIDQIE